MTSRSEDEMLRESLSLAASRKEIRKEIATVGLEPQQMPLVASEDGNGTRVTVEVTPSLRAQVHVWIERRAMETRALTRKGGLLTRRALPESGRDGTMATRVIITLTATTLRGRVDQVMVVIRAIATGPETRTAMLVNNRGVCRF